MQKLVWQRGPPPQQQQHDVNGKNLTGSTSIRANALQDFQKSKQATSPTGQKPSPSFSVHKKIVMEWFSGTQEDERPKPPAKNLAWVLSQINDDVESVPGWRALNEAIIIHDSPLTTIRMIPII